MENNTKYSRMVHFDPFAEMEVEAHQRWPLIDIDRLAGETGGAAAQWFSV